MVEVERAATAIFSTERGGRLRLLIVRCRDESGGEAFVGVMQASDLRESDDLAEAAWHDGAGVGAILVE